MWSWDTRKAMQISQLNGNLVVRFTDYINGQPFFSFLGDNMVNETAEALLELSKREGLPLELKLVPEIAVREINLDKFKVIEDKDNSDYIYETLSLKEMKGNKFNTRRGEAHRFSRNYDNFRVEVLDIFKSKQELVELTNMWFENKKRSVEVKDFGNEQIAIDRFFSYNINSDKMFILGLFLDDRLVGYIVNELLPNKNSMLHFDKTDLSINGAHSYLMKANAEMLLEKNVSCINYEQDLGLLPLQRSKRSFRPNNFLNKFIIK
ncbi:MAG: hypothetical protein UU24_C0007G0021 [Candidatus Nomurabacteria bacterium GW2011_GWA2_40_9]|uniref:Phosphatidylglycerol lysyltransferase C-terminal domain-containing protein n=1 Tax=Candidatus Nomurabacteria bacterium GW2011_GWA2_40_9 TaxID=1618734 RepID=A0A0G0TR78_9BACT|nr:MAG: hypothetical protein UU24_C0007G0021 [Candidatus Nomurabacteria bacterium GW2011_GWA2_40_9]